MPSPLAVEEIQNVVEARPALPVETPLAAGELDTRNNFLEREEARPAREAVAPGAVQAVPAPSPRWDFIQVYAQYADNIECDRVAHIAVAISMLSAVLNRKIRIRHGGQELSLDVWTLLLSTSGLGRNTLLRSARRVLNAASLERTVHDAAWGSREAFFQQIAENPCGLFVWPEMSYVLKRLGDSKFGGVREWITNCYDEFVTPERITYRRTGKSTDTPEIVFPQAPRLNILASSSYAWFVDNVNEEDATGGFIPRWTIVNVPDSNRAISKPRQLHAGAESELGRRLAQIGQLQGEAELSEVERMYDTWYRVSFRRGCVNGDI